MTAIGGTRYPAVGQCIYCLSVDGLTDEHIIPFGLSGTAVLPAASCRACAALTSLVEERVLREESMRRVRAYRELRSRRKHRSAPAVGRLLVPDQNSGEVIELPNDQYPTLLFMPRYPLPAVLAPDAYPGGDVQGILCYEPDKISFGPKPDEVMRGLGLTQATWASGRFHPAEFARMVAKIGYSYAVAARAWPLSFGLPAVVPAILGKRDDIGRWVGTAPGPNTSYEGALHRLDHYSWEWPRRVQVEVQLFADSQTQTYLLVLDPEPD